MFARRAVSGIARLCARFGRDQRGTSAVIYTLALIPLMTAVAASVDYTSAATRRTKLLAAADAAAIRGCKDIQTQTVAVAKQNMQAVFAASFDYPATMEPEVSTSIAAGTVKVRARSMYQLQLGQAFGMNDIELGAESECEYANNTYEIAIVLDNSGSMTESAGSMSRIAAAKSAAKKLVDAMYSGPLSSARIKMSVVPFTLSVNVGAQYRTATWVDTLALSSIHWSNFDHAHINGGWKPANRFTLFDELNVPFGGCFETRPGDFAVIDAPATTNVRDSFFVPQFAPDDPGDQDNNANDYKFKVNGNGANVTYRYENSYLSDNKDGVGFCQGNKHEQHEVNKALTKLCKYRGNPSKSIQNARGPNYMCNGKPLMRMTADPAAIRAKIDTLTADGNTNIFEGFMWGWRTISPNNPFADGRVYGPQPADQPNNVKVIIILTDGVNAWNGLNNPNGTRYSPAGFVKNTTVNAAGQYGQESRFAPLITTNQKQGETAMDTRLKTACANAKKNASPTDPNVIVYTIGFAARRQDVDEAVLTECASVDPDPDLEKRPHGKLYYFSSDSTDLENVFKEIANKLSDLRLTK